MALHFLAFKIVDLVACFLVHDFTNLSVFPHTFIVFMVSVLYCGNWITIGVKENVYLCESFLNKKLMGRVK